MSREMVLFPNEDQFTLKCRELMIDACYWTIPTFPKNKDELIGAKIYFYDKMSNYIVLQATIIAFGWEEDKKKVVYFEIKVDDYSFEEIDLDSLNIDKRKQNRGWCYRFW